MTNDKVLQRANTSRNLLKVNVSRQIRFVGHVMRKNQLEAVTLTGMIEGKRARGRQRKTFMDWISTACWDKWDINEILKICRDRNEHLLIANVRVWHGTYIGSDQSPEHCVFKGCIVQTSIALPFIARFRHRFQRFFHKGLLFQKHYLVRIFVARWRHNFREIAVKNCEKSKKNRRKSLCTPLRIDSWRIWKNSTAVVYGRDCRCAPI